MALAPLTLEDVERELGIGTPKEGETPKTGGNEIDDLFGSVGVKLQELHEFNEPKEQQDPNTVTLPLEQVREKSTVPKAYQFEFDEGPKQELPPQYQRAVYDATEFGKELAELMRRDDAREKEPEDYDAGRKLAAEMIQKDPAQLKKLATKWYGARDVPVFQQGMRDEAKTQLSQQMMIAASAVPMVAGGVMLGAGMKVGAALALGAGLDTIDANTTRRAIWETVQYSFSQMEDYYYEKDDWRRTHLPDDWAKNMAKTAFTFHLVNAGMPWWAALVYGLPVDYKTSLAVITGAGLGVKTLASAGDKGGKLQTLAAKTGLSAPGIEGVVPEIKSQLGVYFKNPFSGKRNLHGVPLTESAVTFLRNNSATMKFMGHFIPEEVNAGPHMRILLDGMRTPAQAANYAAMMKVAGDEVRSVGDILQNLHKTSPYRAQSVFIGSEFINPAKRGSKEALDALDNIFADRADDLALAERFRKLIDDASDALHERSTLRYDELHGGLRNKIDKTLAEQKKAISEVNKRMGEEEKLVGAVGKQVSARERILTSLSEKETSKTGAVETILSKRLAATEKEMRRLQTEVGQPVYEAVDELKGIGKKLEDESEAMWTSDLPREWKLRWVKEKQAKAVGEAAERIELTEPGDIAETLKSVGGLKPGEDVTKKMYGEYRGITTEALRKRAKVQVRIDELAENASELESAVANVTMATKPENLRKLSKALTMGEYKDVSLIHQSLEDITKRKAAATRQLNALHGWLSGRDSKKAVQASLDKFKKTMDVAEELDVAWQGRIDRVPRLGPKPGLLPLTPTATGARGPVDPLSLSSAAHERTLLDKYGRSQSLYEMEKDIRAAINNPDVPQYKEIKQRLVEAYGAKSWEQARQSALKDIGKSGDFWLVSRMVDMDVPNMMQTEIRRMASDAGTFEMVKGMKMFASDVPSKYHTVPAQHFGKLVEGQFKGKYFPQQIMDEANNWRRLANQLDKEPGKMGRVIKWATSLWKFQATAIRPSFQVRNEIDDLLRFATEGAYDPLALHTNGALAMIHGRGAGPITETLGKLAPKFIKRKIPTHINVGKLGRQSYKDLFYLMDGYGLFDSGLASESVIALRGQAGKFSAFSWPENMRRAGLFIERLKQDMVPLEAAISVKKVAYPTTHITRWEKGIRDYFLPFYGFQRHNIPTMAKQLFKNPGWSKVALMVGHAGRMGMGGGEDSPETFDMMPDYIRDVAIHVTREPGLTKVLQMPGLSMADLTGFLDAAGDPKATLNEILKGANRNLAPGPKLAVDLITSFSGLSKRFTSTRVVAPIEFEKLPDSMRVALGIREDIVSREGKYYKQLTMPSWVGATFSYIGLYNDFRKALKPDSLAKAKDIPDFAKKMLSNKESLLGFFTGITWNKVTDADLAYRTMQEMTDGYEDYARSNGMMIGNALITKHQQSAFGQLFSSLKKRTQELYNHKYNLDYMARIGIRETPKDESEEPGEAETVQPVQP